MKHQPFKRKIALKCRIRSVSKIVTDIELGKMGNEKDLNLVFQVKFWNSEAKQLEC